MTRISNLPDMIYNDLHQDISTGKYEVGDLLPSENDLAKKYKSTRFFARKAFDLLEKRGFVVNKRGAGRTITRQSVNKVKRLAIMDSHTVEYYLNQPADLPGHVFQWQSGIYDACHKLGITPIYLTCRVRNISEGQAFLQQVMDSNVDAIINHPGYYQRDVLPQMLAEIRRYNIPTMFFSELSSHEDFDFFHVDNYRVGQMLTEYAIDCGHKKIGFICAKTATQLKHERYQAYINTMEDRNLKIDERYTVILEDNPNIDQWTHRGRNAIKIMSERGVLGALSCIICYNDQMAEGAIDELRARGYSVPGDISIIAFDNDPRCFSCELTTGYFPYVEAVRKATTKFVERINSNSDNFIKLCIKPRIIERKSVKHIN